MQALRQVHAEQLDQQTEEADSELEEITTPAHAHRCHGSASQFEPGDEVGMAVLCLLVICIRRWAWSWTINAVDAFRDLLLGDLLHMCRLDVAGDCEDVVRDGRLSCSCCCIGERCQHLATGQTQSGENLGSTW